MELRPSGRLASCPIPARPRRALAGGWGALLAAFFLLAASPPAGQAPSLQEEEFVYDIHFLWFRQAAEGTLILRRLGERRYRAELVAETKGFIGFLTAYRKNHYISEMEYDPAKRRLLSRVYSKTVYRGLNITQSRTVIDGQKGQIRWETRGNGEIQDKGTERIPEGVIYEDLLSAFFNLRIGAFGPLTRGRFLTVTTLPAYQTTRELKEDYDKEFVRNFDIRIADAETERRYRRAFDRVEEKGLLALVKVPKELFGQTTGEVRLWLDPNLIPVAATVEDVIFFGDVHGTLRKAIVGRAAPAAPAR